MEKKFFANATVRVVRFASSDVITTSTFGETEELKEVTLQSKASEQSLNH